MLLEQVFFGTYNQLLLHFPVLYW